MTKIRDMNFVDFYCYCVSIRSDEEELANAVAERYSDKNIRDATIQSVLEADETDVFTKANSYSPTKSKRSHERISP